MNIRRTDQEAAERLRLGCEICFECLNELIGIHLDMDPVDRSIGPDDDEIVYRLRKVLIHVKSATSWHFDTEVAHVLAPELRAAEKQFDMLWKRVPKERLSDFVSADGDSAIDFRRGSFPTGREILSSYIHPTPQRLLLAREHGGLGPSDEFTYYVQLFPLLGNIAFRYALSLCLLSELWNGGKEERIVSVIERLGEEIDSLSSSDFLQFVSRGKSQIEQNAV